MDDSDLIHCFRDFDVECLDLLSLGPPKSQMPKSQYANTFQDFHLCSTIWGLNSLATLDRSKGCRVLWLRSNGSDPSLLYALLHFSLDVENSTAQISSLVWSNGSNTLRPENALPSTTWKISPWLKASTFTLLLSALSLKSLLCSQWRRSSWDSLLESPKDSLASPLLAEPRHTQGVICLEFSCSFNLQGNSSFFPFSLRWRI